MARSKPTVEPRIGKNVYIDVSAIVTGDVEIGDYSSIWPHAVLRGDDHRIAVGKYTNIQDLCVVHVGDKEPCIIGNSVIVGHQVCLHGCVIEDDCLIGMGSIVLTNAVIEKEVILGAGSLVPEGKRLKSGFVYFGRPAQKIKPMTDQDLESNRYWVKRYHETAMKHLEGYFGRIGLLVSGKDA